ncbi:MAG: hypothetical protein DME26_12410 [Verrucomicrobia bacterium]|nr:MAG: hypothetical protein DME26_12410 [Verrucomicrobiota bacterium]
MDFRTTFTKKPQAAFTLIEVTVVSALSLVVLAALLSFAIFSSRSFVVMTNYTDLDQDTQMALDKMSREIRQVNQLTDYTTNSLTFQDYDGGTLQYSYNPQTRELTRIKNGQRQNFLTECNSLQFSIFKRTPSNDTFQPYPTATVTNTKLIQLTWNCSRSILGSKANTESMQSAKVVIRKK